MQGLGCTKHITATAVIEASNCDNKFSHIFYEAVETYVMTALFSTEALSLCGHGEVTHNIRLRLFAIRMHRGEDRFGQVH